MKANQDLLVMLVDVSGSMHYKIGFTLEACNAMLAQQVLPDRNCDVEVWKFNTEMQKLLELQALTQDTTLSVSDIQCRGGTAMNDSICLLIDEVGRRLANMPEAQRPEKVIFAIQTDGEENSSHMFSNADVKSRIEHQQAKYGWEFFFLGADVDAFAIAGNYGIAESHTLSYKGTQESTVKTMGSLSRSLLQARVTK